MYLGSFASSPSLRRSFLMKVRTSRESGSAGDRHEACGVVDREIAQPVGFARRGPAGRRSPTPGRLDPRHQFSWRERFDGVVVGARCEGPRYVLPRRTRTGR